MLSSKWKEPLKQASNSIKRALGVKRRITCFLENHLIGDPTFHFTNNAGLDMGINQALVVQK